MQLAVDLLILLLLAAGTVAFAVFMIAAQRNAVPPVWTPARALDEVLRALDLPDKGTFVDVGSGDGRVLEAVLRERPELRAVGVENNPVVWLRGRVRLGRRARLVFGQIEDLKLDGAERVFAYLGPGLMAKLETRFEKELPKGARVVSQQFPLPKRRPDRTIDLKAGKAYAARLYVYDY